MVAISAWREKWNSSTVNRYSANYARDLLQKRGIARPNPWKGGRRRKKRKEDLRAHEAPGYLTAGGTAASCRVFLPILRGPVGDTMIESTEVRRKRALYRSWHRGTRELDEILGPFAERHVNAMAEPQLDEFETLLEHPDPQLFAWFVEREPVPPGDADGRVPADGVIGKNVDPPSVEPSSHAFAAASVVTEQV